VKSLSDFFVRLLSAVCYVYVTVLFQARHIASMALPRLQGRSRGTDYEVEGSQTHAARNNDSTRASNSGIANGLVI